MRWPTDHEDSPDSQAAATTPSSAVVALDWRNPSDPDEIAQLLDEHHLVVIGDDSAVRREFARRLVRHLESRTDSAVVRLDGDAVTDLGGFCREMAARLERIDGLGWESRWHAEPGDPGEPDRVQDVIRETTSVDGLIDALRRHAPDTRYQYVIWDSADMLLESDVRLFGRIVNALFGVAAEREHVSPDLLLIQRMVLLGGHKLGAYAEDPAGQLRTWVVDHDDSPFWEVASCVARPPVLTYRIDG